MQVETRNIQEAYNYNNFFKLLEVRFCHEKFDGKMSSEMTRVVFERGNAAAVLLYDADDESVLLTKQFRYPALMHGGPGWLIEVVAGVLDKGRDAVAVSHSELIEEIGYQVSELHFLCRCYLSPGASTEQIHIYLAYLQQAERIGEGGGLEAENEDIQLLRLPLNEALNMIRCGEILDAKTIIALQQLQALKTSLTRLKPPSV
ncbi:MAG: NUDIX domain-containing protein [bacterium]|nr:NUDIX domain-containing protein [bacterium]